MAPHSSTLAWKIPWTEEPGRLQSMGSWRVGHDWSDLAAAAAAAFFAFIHLGFPELLGSIWCPSGNLESSQLWSLQMLILPIVSLLFFWSPITCIVDHFILSQIIYSVFLSFCFHSFSPVPTAYCVLSYVQVPRFFPSLNSTFFTAYVEFF